MKRTAIAVATVLTLAGVSALTSQIYLSSPAMAAPAAEKTTTFAIKNMTCSLCPVTVRKAMEHVPGVKSVKVDFGAKTATVVYNPALASTGKIVKASTDAGYPAAAVR